MEFILIMVLPLIIGVASLTVVFGWGWKGKEGLKVTSIEEKKAASK